MNILITGAAGFIGKNLTEALKSIRDGKDKTHPEIVVDQLYLYDVDSDDALLDEACKNADFVFHLAGVNRPQDATEFMQCNFGFTSVLLDQLKMNQNRCPIVFASSIQATCVNKYADSEYGKSKKAAEELLCAYAKETEAKVMIYRFPNIFGKWCRANYNSVVATFCHNIANDLPIDIHNRATQLEFLYIDDLIDEMLRILEGRGHYCVQDNQFCFVPITHTVTLGEIADLLQSFHDQSATLTVPEMQPQSFAKKLYATYLSYLPKEKTIFPLMMHTDHRGSFTELLHAKNNGQVSVNVLKPGITKGQHWHHTKCEIFVVVSGHGLIEMRKIGAKEAMSFEVSGDKIQAVYMLPGYTHSISNLSASDDLIVVMWASECFDPQKPDTFAELVE